MGQAKKRGTFEERKAQAIAEGRIKTPTEKRRQIKMSGEPMQDFFVVMGLFNALQRKKGR